MSGTCVGRHGAAARSRARIQPEPLVLARRPCAAARQCQAVARPVAAAASASPQHAQRSPPPSLRRRRAAPATPYGRAATRYGTPPTLVLTTGTPQASASRTEFGVLSARDGFSTTSADWYSVDHVGGLEATGESHRVAQTELGRERARRCVALRSGARDRQTCASGIAAATLRKRPERDVIAVEVARDCA